MVKTSQSSGQTKIGILGGGQLARMLILRGHQMGLEMSVLCPSAEDPAAQVCQKWTQGSPKNVETVRQFLKSIDFLTFESEFVDDEVIKLLKKSSKVLPRAKNMEMFQDRWSQKKSLEEAKIPTARFQIPSSDSDETFKQFPGGYVLKARRFGYDGNGTWVIKEKKSKQPKGFFKSHHNFIAEEFIPFKRELALTFICSAAGQIISFPLVETKQQDHRCLWVKGPTSHQVHPELERKLKKYLKSIDYVGAITFELFDTGEKLLINEVAPRVHNSAHYSWDALTEDQFSLHLKAILGLKLSRPKLLSEGFAMYNLIGSHKRQPQWKLSPHASLHWYGKKDNRPGRKMGHLNARAKTSSQALTLLKKTKKDFDL